jgi:hypothetical protein
MNNTQAQAWGIFYASGEATRHLLLNKPYFTWHIRSTSPAQLRTYLRVFTAAFGHDQFTLDASSLTARGHATRKMFYDAFYDHYGRKVVPPALLHEAPEQCHHFIRGALCTRLDDDTSFHVRRETYRELYCVLQRAQRRYGMEPCDHDDDLLRLTL